LPMRVPLQLVSRSQSLLALLKHWLLQLASR
jgi:hypothetical protein